MSFLRLLCACSAQLAQVAQLLHGVDVVVGTRVHGAWQRQLNFSSSNSVLYFGRWYTKDWWWRWCLYLRIC